MIRSPISFHFFPVWLLENVRWRKWLAFFLPFSCWLALPKARRAESRLCRGSEVGESSGVRGPELPSLGFEGGLARAGAGEVAVQRQERSTEPFESITDATGRIFRRDVP